MSTNDEQYDGPDEVQDEEAELSEDDLDDVAGGRTRIEPDVGSSDEPGEPIDKSIERLED